MISFLWRFACKEAASLLACVSLLLISFLLYDTGRVAAQVVLIANTVLFTGIGFQVYIWALIERLTLSVQMTLWLEDTAREEVTYVTER